MPLGNPRARSQARRILRRLDEFEEIIFDFQGIDFMGRGLQMKYSGISESTSINPVNSGKCK